MMEKKQQKNGTDNRTTNSNNKTTNELTNHSTNISDRRYSDTPQNHLENVRDGNYVTNYNYDSGEDNSSSNGNSTATNNSTDNNIYQETIERTPNDKISILREIQTNINSIYSMIFKDLECLFYQLV